MVREFCANLTLDGGCMGIPVQSLAAPPGKAVAHPLGKCLIAERKRCSYFERCILPLADWRRPEEKKGAQQGRLKARATYHRLHRISVPELEEPRVCPDCGALLAKRARYCEICSKDRRKKNARAWWRKKGKNGGPDSIVNEKRDFASP